MRPSKFSEDQIKQAIAQVRAGTPLVAMCRKLGVTQTTFYRWRREFAGLPRPEVRRLRELEKENARLKRLLAERDALSGRCLAEALAREKIYRLSRSPADWALLLRASEKSEAYARRFAQLRGSLAPLASPRSKAQSPK